MSRERVADGVYRYERKPKDGKKAEVRYGATVWVRGAWGERVQRRKHGFLTEKAAKTWRAQEIAASASGLAATGGDVKLGAWIEQYLALHVRSWSHGTYRSQVAVLRMVEPLWALPLRRVTPALIAARFSQLQDDYKATTVRHARATLSQCLKQAVDYGLIPRNPVLAVKPPPKPGRRDEAWTAEQVRRLLDAAVADEEFGLICRVLAECWLRVGEVCGLTWADLDLNRRELHVRRTVQRGPQGAVLGEVAKTDRSVRTLPLTDDLARAMRHWQDRDRLAEGRGWHADRCVFGVDGRFRETTWVRRHLRAACERAGLPVITPHALRHAGASIAIRAGMDAKVVSERLGHATASFTMDRYVHTNAADHRQAADTFSDLISGAS